MRIKKIKKWLKKTWLWQFLSRKDMPIGVTLLLFLATAAGTYFLTPKVNEELEIQKIKSSYLITNLNSINETTQQILISTKEAVNALLENRPIPSSTKNVFEKATINLQSKAYELGIIFDDKASIEIIRKYQADLDNLRRDMENAANSNDTQKILASAEIFLKSRDNVLRLLAAKANLHITIMSNQNK